jgi:CheY-like chemotaxis protein
MSKKLDSVCIIDDDFIYQFLAKEEIAYTNMVESVIFFNNGDKAVQFLTSTLGNNDQAVLPDIIFLDINMPVMDGWEFLEAYAILKPQLGKNITIYVVSSSTDVRDFDRAKAISDVSDYIIKPVSGNQLKNIFNNLLA